MSGMSEDNSKITSRGVWSEGSGNVDGARRPSTEIAKYADVAMYRSEPMPKDAVQGPTATLINVTPNPIRTIAAGTAMYKGKVVRDLFADLTQEEALDLFMQVKKTHLKAPFELVNLHFFIEGVSRSFTHQMVRQRTAVYMQESLRFAVKESLDEETPLPPSLAGLKDDDPRVRLWRKGINNVQDVYEALVDAGVPAEDARGLLPHATTTRLHYNTNLRALQDHAGMRLCTQAQFEWRVVFLQMVKALRNYCSCDSIDHGPRCDAWEFQALADLFVPVCYLTGKCEFMASFDRACSIRERVTANHEVGRGSEFWDQEYDQVEGNPIVVGVGPKSVLTDGTRPVFIGAIHPAEWLADPSAARVQ